MKISAEQLDKLLNERERAVLMGEMEDFDLMERLTEEQLQDQDVFETVLKYLMAKYVYYKDRVEESEDMGERKRLIEMRDYYHSFFRFPEATEQWVYTFCQDQCFGFNEIGRQDGVDLWLEIGEAVRRYLQS